MRELKIRRYREEETELEKFLKSDEYKAIVFQRELEIAKRIQQGDLGAIEEIRNSVACEFLSQQIDWTKLVKTDTKGIKKAAEEYDEATSLKFSAFAARHIRQSLLEKWKNIKCKDLKHL